MKKLRIYVDTSVIGGCFDAEFAVESNLFIKQVQNGKYNVLISELTVQELVKAPQNIRDLLKIIPDEHKENIDITDEIQDLAREYMKVGVTGSASRYDGLHVAAATVAVAAIISLLWAGIVALLMHVKEARKQRREVDCFNFTLTA